MSFIEADGEVEKLSAEEIANIQAQNTADYNKGHQVGIDGLEKSSASSDIDED